MGIGLILFLFASWSPISGNMSVLFRSSSGSTKQNHRLTKKEDMYRSGTNIRKECSLESLRLTVFYCLNILRRGLGINTGMLQYLIKNCLFFTTVNFHIFWSSNPSGFGSGTGSGSATKPMRIHYTARNSRHSQVFLYIISPPLISSSMSRLAILDSRLCIRDTAGPGLGVLEFTPLQPLP
jgi:hypothetical protein